MTRTRTETMLLEALEGVLTRYVDLVKCGDCGFWDPEKETVVIAARRAIATAKGEDRT